MATVRVDQIEYIAVALATLTAVIHISLGGAGLFEYATTGTLPNALSPVFVLAGLVVVLGIGAGTMGVVDRGRIYTYGVVLMVLHLVAYLDWHFLHVVERFVDLGELGHAHVHTHTERAVATTLLEAGVRAPGAALALAAQGSLIVSAASHAASAPVEWMAKLAELVLVALLLVLRWTEGQELDVVRWNPLRTHLRGSCIVAIVGVTAWLTTLFVGGSLVDRGLSSLFVDVLELTVFAIPIVGLGWFTFGKPVVEATSGATISFTRWLPGMEPRATIPNVAIAVVYLVVFFAVVGVFVAAVPGDGGGLYHDHHHDHGSDDGLETMMDTAEAEGVDVDREWTMIHYSEYHGDDALLFDHVVDPKTDTDTIHAEIAVIVTAYVSAVEQGKLDEVVVVLGEAWTPADESFARWEIDREWVDAYLADEWSWDRLLETVLDTYEEREGVTKPLTHQ